MYLLFIKKSGCPKCKELENTFKNVAFRKDQLKIFDVEEMTGLAEATYFGHYVKSIPAILAVSKEADEEVIFYTNDLLDIKKILGGLQYEEIKEHSP